MAIIIQTEICKVIIKEDEIIFEWNPNLQQKCYEYAKDLANILASMGIEISPEKIIPHRVANQNVTRVSLK